MNPLEKSRPIGQKMRPPDSRFDPRAHFHDHDHDDAADRRDREPCDHEEFSFSASDKWGIKKKLGAKRSVKVSMIAAHYRKRADELVAQGYEIESPEVRSMLDAAASYRRRAERIGGCASQIQTKSCEDGHVHKITRAILCHDRACPTCQWRRALKYGQAFYESCEAHPGDYIHLIFSVPNPPNENLREVLNILQKAVGMTLRHPLIKPWIQGYGRSLETTHNETTDTFHPHVHVMPLVSDNYFSDQNPLSKGPYGPRLWRWIFSDILESLNWRDLYPAAYKERDPDTGAYIRNISDFGIKKVSSVRAGAIEVCGRYIAKEEDINSLSVRSLAIWMHAVAGQRLWNTGGVLKTNQDPDEEDLIHIRESRAETVCSVCGKPLVIIDWEWNRGRYRKSDHPLSWPQNEADYFRLANRQRRRNREERNQIYEESVFDFFRRLAND
jgi:hypothetical protein